jgi:hypothetical protein
MQEQRDALEESARRSREAAREATAKQIAKQRDQAHADCMSGLVQGGATIGAASCDVSGAPSGTGDLVRGTGTVVGSVLAAEAKADGRAADRHALAAGQLRDIAEVAHSSSERVQAAADRITDRMAGLSEQQHQVRLGILRG